jgi:hypothetical protein
VSHCAFFQQKKKKKKGKGGATTINTDSATGGSDANQSEDAAATAAAAAAAPSMPTKPEPLKRSVSWGEDEVREFREEDMWKQKKKKWAAQVSTAMAHGDHLAGDGDML